MWSLTTSTWTWTGSSTLAATLRTSESIPGNYSRLENSVWSENEAAIHLFDLSIVFIQSCSELLCSISYIVAVLVINIVFVSIVIVVSLIIMLKPCLILEANVNQPGVHILNIPIYSDVWQDDIFLNWKLHVFSRIWCLEIRYSIVVLFPCQASS